jgi:hypothetical protein
LRLEGRCYEAGGYDNIIRDAALLDMTDFARHIEALTLEGDRIVT